MSAEELTAEQIEEFYREYVSGNPENDDTDIKFRAICDAAKRSLLPSGSVAVPTDSDVETTLALFRSELDKNMRNSSGSPGHDAMRVALHDLFKHRFPAPPRNEEKT